MDGKTLVDAGLEWPDDGPLTACIWELVAQAVTHWLSADSASQSTLAASLQRRSRS